MTILTSVASDMPPTRGVLVGRSLEDCVSWFTKAERRAVTRRRDPCIVPLGSSERLAWSAEPAASRSRSKDERADRPSASRDQASSSKPAAPMPPPMHMLTIAYLP